VSFSVVAFFTSMSVSTPKPSVFNGLRYAYHDLIETVLYLHIKTVHAHLFFD
jgi:hypothetical protein